jgi:hypothetical protein
MPVPAMNVNVSLVVSATTLVWPATLIVENALGKLAAVNTLLPFTVIALLALMLPVTASNVPLQVKLAPES